MKHRSAAYQLPAEAGYFTTRQWESAFRGAFSLLQQDARLRERLVTAEPSLSSKQKNRSQNRSTHQEAAHVQAR